MNALDIIRQVEELGGQLTIDDGQLKVRAPEPLPQDVMEAVRTHKPTIMVALGVPFDQTVASVLKEIRPFLAPSLQRLPDDRLLALVNWNIMAAWQKAIGKLPL